MVDIFQLVSTEAVTWSSGRSSSASHLRVAPWEVGWPLEKRCSRKANWGSVEGGGAAVWRSDRKNKTRQNDQRQIEWVKSGNTNMRDVCVCVWRRVVPYVGCFNTLIRHLSQAALQEKIYSSLSVLPSASPSHIPISYLDRFFFWHSCRAAWMCRIRSVSCSS